MKRGAEKQLNYDNWDEPEEHTDSGKFEKADPETLKARKILVVRRNSTQPSSNKLGIFKSFDAFGAVKTTSPNSSSTTENSDAKSPNDAYLAKLSVLNKEFLAWVTKHVSEDPYCILTPIFGDYSRHLLSIETSASSSEDNAKTAHSSEKAPTDLNSSQPFSFQSSTTAAPPPLPAPFKPSFPNGGFTFSFSQTSTSSESPKPVFSFGLSAMKNTSVTSSTTPAFSFSATPKEATEEAKSSTNDAEDEEYVPPKPEVREIKEEGSVFTMRCKLFYKKADQWTERGLGNLHIIPSDDQKFQLLIRADTNLGNILLNILMTKDIPVRLQKNNITFACVPSPPLPGDKETDASSPARPVPMLVRVKTEDMAKELLKNLDKYRGKAE
ncbi:hypothetical protein AAHC03_01711 [Spirometra sp. Aus1]